MYKKHQVHSVDQRFSPGAQWLRYLTNFNSSGQKFLLVSDLFSFLLGDSGLTTSKNKAKCTIWAMFQNFCSSLKACVWTEQDLVMGALQKHWKNNNWGE